MATSASGAGLPAADLLDAFDRQAAWCSASAPFTAALLNRTRAWLESDGEACAAFLAAHPQPRAAATPLRWAGALHHLALQQVEPFAGLWPPAVPPADAAGLDRRLDEAVRTAWTAHRPAIEAALRHPPQTNEVMRSTALLPGLLFIARATGLPLALWELGASAGLNLYPDRYRHDHGGWTWPPAAGGGTPVHRPADGPVPPLLQAEWTGALPGPLAAVPLQVLERHGGDLAPMDLRDPAARLRLASFVWADQRERLRRLHDAMAAVAAWQLQDAVSVQAASAEDFVDRMLATHAARAIEGALPGAAAARTTVLMHSVVWQYLPAAAQQAVGSRMARAGAAATPAAPLAWLTLEPPAADLGTRLRVTLWPPGRSVELAHGHPHGLSLAWPAEPLPVAAPLAALDAAGPPEAA